MFAFNIQNFVTTKTSLNSCLFFFFGWRLTNIKKELLLLIRTDSGIFLMQMILLTALWVIIQARIGSDCMRLLGNTLLWIWMKRYFFTVQIFQMMGIKFRMMCELNIFIKLKIKGFWILGRCRYIKICWLNF